MNTPSTSQALPDPVQKNNPPTAAKSTGTAPPINAPQPKGVLRHIFRSKDLRKSAPLLILSSFMANILALALPLSILLLLDRVIVNRSTETLVVLLLGVLTALLLEEVLRVLNSRVTTWLAARFEHSQTSSSLAHLLWVPLRLLRREEPGVHVNRLLSTTQISDFFSGQALLVIFDLPFIALFLVVIWFIGGPIILVPIVILIIFALLAYISAHWMRDHLAQRMVLDDRRYNFLNEILCGMHSVKLMAMERLMHRRYERLQESNVDQSTKLTYGNAMTTDLGAFFSWMMILGVISSGAFLVVDGSMTPGRLAACMMLSVRALQPLRRAMSVWLRYQSFINSYQRLDTLMNMPTEHGSSAESLPAIRSSVELRDIDVLRAEGGEKFVFQGLRLNIPALACIAVQGESGTGKSSLLNLLSGMHQPDRGHVLVDGRKLSDFNPESVSQVIALLPQRGHLVSGTIMENMTMFDPNKIEIALQISARLGLTKAISGMKLGYDTVVGHGLAQTLPSGVSQRVAIVRALITDPSVILFDEANIDLDSEGDRQLRAYLQQEKGKRTIIMVTHRPSLLALADSTFVIQDGKLVPKLDAPKPDPVPTNTMTASAMPDDLSSTALFEELHLEPFFEQQSDLSLCLIPLLKAMGWQGTALELTEALPHMTPSLDISGFQSIFNNLGYQAERQNTRLAELDDRLLPCLFVPQHEPARIILDRLPDGRFLIFDSALNNASCLEPIHRSNDACTMPSEADITAKQPAGVLQGKVYTFLPREDRLGTDVRERGWVSALASRFKWYLVAAFGITVVSTLLGLATPLFVRIMYDRVIPAGDAKIGFMLLAGVLIALILNWFLRRFKSQLLSFMAGRAEYLIGNTVFQRILELPVGATENTSPGRQMMRLKSFESLREFFLGPLATLFLELPATLVLVVVVGLLNPYALPVLAVSALCFLILGLLSYGPQSRLVQQSSQQSGQRWEFLMETLNGVRTLRSTGAVSLWLNRFQDLSGRASFATFQTSWFKAKISATARYIGTTTGVVVLGVCMYGAMQGWMTTGSLIATLIIVWRLVGPMQNTLMAATVMARTSGTLRQLDSLMHLPTEGNEAVRRTKRPPVQGAISFARCSFRYSNDADPALLGVTFSVKPGRMVTIAGPNGSGKSTLLKLMLRAYTPQAGSIRLDEVDLRQIPHTDLRSLISYMPQTCQLFYGTIEQNLRLNNPTARPADIQWALEMSGLLQEVEEFPEGLRTRISNNIAEQLPNGFRQRLSLARVMVKPTPLVLLDEPENGMDSWGDQAVIRCLEHLKRRATVFLVSHRPSYMRQSDAVIYLENAVVKKIGTYDETKAIILAELNK